MDHQRVLWLSSSEDDDLYAIGPNAVSLYRNDTLVAFLPPTPSDSEFRCMDWEHTQSRIALGSNNGKVAVINVPNQFVGGTKLKVEREFSVRFSRPCNAVQFSPNMTQHIAVGLDKIRNANCGLVWDITQLPSASSFMDPVASANAEVLPLVEFSPSEAVNCLTWLPEQPWCCAVGAGFKWLRLYDVRSPTESILLGTHPKSVLGVSASPFNPYLLASYSEDGVVKLWDSRKPTQYGSIYSSNLFSHSLYSPDTANIVSVIQHAEWSPTQEGVLVVCVNGVPGLQFLDFSSCSTAESMNRGKLYQYTRNVHLSTNCRSFSFHKSIPQRVLLLEENGNVLDTKIMENLPIDWTPSSFLLAGLNSSLKTFSSLDPDVLCFEDALNVLIQRSKLGYGLNFQQNIQALANLGAESHANQELIAFWKWMQISMEFWAEENENVKKPQASPVLNPAEKFGMLAKRNASFNNFQSIQQQQHHAGTKNVEVQIPGIFSLLEGSQSKASQVNFGRFITVYESPRRNQALKMLGWRPLGESGISEIQRSLFLASASSERLSALAIFHLDLSLAVTCLTKDSDSSSYSNLVAMALSGYSSINRASPNDLERSLWIKTCDNLRSQIENSYLRSIFAFLCSKDDLVHSEILFDDRILLTDRIAFACRFLGDTDLLSYLEKILVKCSNQGNLMGLSLTGLTVRAFDVLQGYVDKTSDVQTAAAVSCHVLPFLDSKTAGSVLAKSSIVWIESYRNLLDRCQLWNIRAKFDHDRNLLNKSYGLPSEQFVNNPPSMFAKCGFCSQPLSSFPHYSNASNPSTMAARPLLAGSSRLLNANSGSSVSVKSSTCANCKKALPRCSICLMTLSLAVNSALSRNTAPTTTTIAHLQPRPLSKLSGADNSLESEIAVPSNESSLGQNFSMQEWIVWCQNCRHGGHCGHLMEWFSTHSECPVTDCNCPCSFF